MIIENTRNSHNTNENAFFHLLFIIWEVNTTQKSLMLACRIPIKQLNHVPAITFFYKLKFINQQFLVQPNYMGTK